VRDIIKSVYSEGSTNCETMSVVEREKPRL